MTTRTAMMVRTTAFLRLASRRVEAKKRGKKDLLQAQRPSTQQLNIRETIQVVVVAIALGGLINGRV